jgi:hypothetical protein
MANIDQDFKDKQWRSFGYKMLSEKQCLELLDYRNIEHRKTSYVDESTPNALHMVFVAGRKYSLNSVEELQKFVQEVDHD